MNVIYFILIWAVFSAIAGVAISLLFPAIVFGWLIFWSLVGGIVIFAIVVLLTKI